MQIIHIFLSFLSSFGFFLSRFSFLSMTKTENLPREKMPERKISRVYIRKYLIFTSSQILLFNILNITQLFNQFDYTHPENIFLDSFSLSLIQTLKTAFHEKLTLIKTFLRYETRREIHSSACDSRRKEIFLLLYPQFPFSNLKEIQNHIFFLVCSSYKIIVQTILVHWGRRFFFLFYFCSPFSSIQHEQTNVLIVDCKYIVI